MTASPDRPTSLAKIGRAVLRLRLLYGWSQAELARRAKLSQGTISRLERGLQRGLSIRRLAAVMDALHVGEVMFDRPATVPQTDLEIMLFGDPWKRAVEGADRRLRWPVPKVQGAGISVDARDYGDADGDADDDADDDAQAADNALAAEDALARTDTLAGREPAAWFGGGG